MKLLDDIVNGAVDDKIPLSTTLRRCLVVADALQNGKLKNWVRAELNGYDNRDNLPPYRIMKIQAVGMFVGLGYPPHEMLLRCSCYSQSES